jgi:peptidoglycan/LPS O-acetylase OafA/YrhL
MVWIGFIVACWQAFYQNDESPPKHPASVGTFSVTWNLSGTPLHSQLMPERSLPRAVEPGSTRPPAVGTQLPYRPGLDGLRALAVAGVVLYHAGVSWMPGGFLGVDVFFVLSGYLITSLLLAERRREGRVGFKAFWLRRARRLLPAVLLVIFVCLLAASTIARDDLARTRGDALASLVYMTNWHLIAASHSYFNAFGRPSLLQHLWSLAVEEQFYLFWPLVLLGSLKLVGRRWTILLTVLLALASTALMWGLFNPNQDPSRVYYGTDTRASTLLVGALLAFAWPLGGFRDEVSRRAARVLDGVGCLALLGVLAFFVRVQDYDPWMYRGGFLLVALCTAVLIAVVVHPASVLGRALGTRTLRWIGVRSYGIYLWHWPVMMLTRPGIDVPWRGTLVILAQIALTLVLAALSYRYVETPVRSGAAQRRLRAWLDAHTPQERLRWTAGSLAGAVLVLGLMLGLPAPGSAVGSGQTATPAALVRAANLAGALRGGAAGTGAGDPGGSSLSASALAGKDGAADADAATGPLPSGPILALGDSVMLGCAPVLEQRLGSRLRVDAVVGRQAFDTIERIAEYRAEGALPQTVIVQLGDNGPVWYANMQRLRTVLRGVRHVVIVNVRVARSWQNEVNSELAAYVSSWPQAVLANWYAHSSEGLLVDGVHPSVPGRSIYASVVVDALREAAARG